MKDITEATAPTKVYHQLAEREVQEKCVKWARSRGHWARKFSSMSQRSVPDYLFAKHDLGLYDHLKFACEFKREGALIHKETGCMSTKAQVDEQVAMRDAGWYVFECSEFEHFRSTVLWLECEAVDHAQPE